MPEMDIHNNHINQPNSPSPSDNRKEQGVAESRVNLIHGKAWMVFAGLCVLAVAIIIKVFVIQLFPDESAQALAQSFTYKVNEIEPVRGQIMSSDGSLLATSVPEYEIQMGCKSDYDKEEYKLQSGFHSHNHSARLFGDKSSCGLQSTFSKKRMQKEIRYAEIRDHVDYNDCRIGERFSVHQQGSIQKRFCFRTEIYS
jgi:cell division protein FtsI (penicillin-binding protein 3)